VRAAVVLLALALVAVAPACGGGSAASSASAGLTSIAAPLPPGVGPRHDVQLNAATCASAGNCVVTGDVYERGPLGALGVLLVQTAGKWRVVTVPQPHDLPQGTKQIAAVGSISCPAAGRCVGVGSAHAGHSSEAIFMTQRGTRWVERTMKLPAGAKFGVPSAISCATAGNCSVVGGVADSKGGDQHLLFLDETRGRWGSWLEEALPPRNQPELPAGGDLISCQAPGDCTATGS
jgi:hypothetical protein